MLRIKRSFLLVLIFIFYFVGMGHGYINDYAPDSPWILNPEGVRVLKVDPDGSIRVRPQDQTTPQIIIYANMITNETLLSSPTAKDDKIITVDDPTGIVIAPAVDRSYIGIFDLLGNQFYAGFAIGLSGNDVTLDTPLPGVFPTGSTIGIGVKNMAVDGSVTPKIFTLRGADPGLQLSVDVTRFMIYCVTTNAVNLTDFGDIAGGLTNGIVIRKVDGTTINLVNYHSNIEMKGIMYDWESLDDSNPGQGLHGFSGRFSIDKLGSIIRIGPGDSIEFIVQDDLSTILELYIIPEGSIVIP